MNWLKENWGSILVGALIVGSVAYGYNEEPTKQSQDYYQLENSREIENSYIDFDGGYSWAEENDIDNFDDCQSEFGTSEEEDGCNEYVKDNYTGHETFGGYECTEDCSGHEAGYNWAEENGIDNEEDCDGNSESFIEGCYTYVEDNY